MSRVKVKPVLSPRVIQPNDPSRPWWLLLFVLLLLVLIWQSFESGRFRGGYDHSRSVKERNQLRDTILMQDQELSALAVEAAKYRRSSQVDTEAVRRSKTDMKNLLDERALLKKEVSFLRGLLSAQNGPLYIRDFKLTSGAEERQFEYSFTIAQVLDDFGTTRGKLLVYLVGMLGGKQQEIKQETVTLKFVNYQEIQGSVELPEGFEPLSLRLDVKPGNRKLKKFSKSIAWDQGDQETL